LKHKILFVCLGNICRSPLAEAIFSRMASERGTSNQFYSDSCGTSGHHTGEPPDPRTLKNARSNNLEIAHLGRQLSPEDFVSAQLILTMDSGNYRDTMALALKHGFEAGNIRMLRMFDPEAANGDLDVPDPWYGGEQGFEDVFKIISRSCSGLMDALQASYPHLP
jgi:protein-tyrosine phosphatase